MRTNIEIDDRLMKQAMKASGSTTKRATVEEGLRLLVKTQARRGILKLFGKVEFAPDYDYKAMRAGEGPKKPSTLRGSRKAERVQAGAEVRTARKQAA